MKDFSKYDDKQLIGFISLEGKECEFAFKEIYFRYAKRIFSHCNLKCVNQDEAKYMHQEIWMIFFQAIKDGKTDIKLPHYLYGIARNIYLQNCKKQNKQTIFNEDKFEMLEEQDLLEYFQIVAEVCGIETARLLIKELGGITVSFTMMTSLRSLLEGYIKENAKEIPIKKIARELGMNARAGQIFLSQ